MIPLTRHSRISLGKSNLWWLGALLAWWHTWMSTCVTVIHLKNVYSFDYIEKRDCRDWCWAHSIVSSETGSGSGLSFVISYLCHGGWTLGIRYIFYMESNAIRAASTGWWTVVCNTKIMVVIYDASLILLNRDVSVFVVVGNNDRNVVDVSYFHSYYEATKSCINVTPLWRTES